MDIYQLVGKTVKGIRIKRNLTQEQVSDASGITPHFLSRIENGREKASLDTLARLSKSLRVSPATLMADIKYLPEADDDLATLATAYGKLSRKQKAMALPLLIALIDALKEM